MDFHKLVTLLNKHFDSIKNLPLVKLDLDKETLWDTYLGSFPEGTNPIYVTNTEHDCNCCKSYIRKMGNVCAIKDGELVSIWDFDAQDKDYQVVIDALRDYVLTHDIQGYFMHDEELVGTVKNVSTVTHVGVEFKHFHSLVPKSLVVESRNLATQLGQKNTAAQQTLALLDQINVDACDTVISLIESNSLYRGSEFLGKVQAACKFLITYAESNQDKELYSYTKATYELAGIKNSVIGTLLVDLTKGEDLEVAVGKYEAKVAPQNYKRSSALVTQGMIDKAYAKVVELGLEDALPRRQAVIEDLTINDVLFADRSAKKAMGAFDGLLDSVPKKSNAEPSKAEDCTIDQFINEVLPKADTVELYLANQHLSNLVTLSAPVNKDSGQLFKWDNNFSWSYKGDVTDAITERVKAAGGKVDGVLRVSLAWHNSDDLDLHVHTSSKHGSEHMYYQRSARQGRLSGGELDLDMNGLDKNDHENPVENVIWTDPQKVKDRQYTIKVHNYSRKNMDDKGYTIQVVYGGETLELYSEKSPRDGDADNVIQFSIDAEGKLVLPKGFTSSGQVKEEWGMVTGQWQKVSAAMFSPNHWNQEQVGNKHFFLMLEDAMNPEPVRGFYNEYLNGDLYEHRKVFEILGSKMKAEPTDKQLSGVGFSLTKGAEFHIKVTNSDSIRTYKVTV